MGRVSSEGKLANNDNDNYDTDDRNRQCAPNNEYNFRILHPPSSIHIHSLGFSGIHDLPSQLARDFFFISPHQLKRVRNLIMHVSRITVLVFLIYCECYTAILGSSSFFQRSTARLNACRNTSERE